MKKPELLAPAGDFESLEAAVYYGADAVYLGGKVFTMRTSSHNFDNEELTRAVKFAHSKGVRIFLTCNTLPRNDEIHALPKFFEESAQAGVDAFIISDLGVMELAQKYASQVEIHASTQTGIVNYAAANALYRHGVKRVVLARELSLKEIACLRENIPQSLEIEAFVHGAMCVSFSGRCLLSSYMTGRDANRGNCAQPCRWKYALSEEKRPGEYFPIFEDEKGTHIMNARDLCMIEHIPKLIEAGISSLKIEGRAKSAYYVATVINAYRIAIDRWFANPEEPFDASLLKEVEAISHRNYCTGFYFGPIEKGQVYENNTYIRNYDIIAVAESIEDGLVRCRTKNPFGLGNVEVVEPGRIGRAVEIKAIFDESGNRLTEIRRPNIDVLLELSEPLKPHAILRAAAK